MFQSYNLAILFVVGTMSLGIVLCIEWTTVPDSVVYSCSGNQVTFPWKFSLDQEERVLLISWIFGDIFDSVLVATVSFQTFVSTKSYQPRVQYVPNGGLTLRDVTPRDLGNYTVEVNVERQGVLSTYRHSVFLQVGDGLMTQDSKLTVTQDPVAVWDEFTEQWGVRLACGPFTFWGQPNINVTWIAPGAETRSSSYFGNNNFYLTLFSPVVGGNYTCLIPTHLLPDVCVNTSVHDNETVSATIVVDDLRARLSVIEAEQKTLADRLKQSEAANTEMVAVLNETRTMYDQQLETLNGEFQALLNVTQNQHVLLTNQRMQAAFTVRFNSNNGDIMNVGSGGTIKFDLAVSNHGNHFNMSTGVFTAPVAGTYLFLLGAMIPRGQPYSEMGICVSGKGCVALTHGDQNMIRDQTHATLHLSAGSQVMARHAWGGSVISKYTWTTFSGVLVQPD